MAKANFSRHTTIWTVTQEPKEYKASGVSFDTKLGFITVTEEGKFVFLLSYFCSSGNWYGPIIQCSSLQSCLNSVTNKWWRHINRPKPLTSAEKDILNSMVKKHPNLTVQQVLDFYNKRES